MGKLRAALTGVLVIFIISMISTIAIDYMLNDVSIAKSLIVSVIIMCMTFPIFFSEYSEDGCIVVDEADDGSLRFTIECNEDPEEWIDKERIMLSVKRKEAEED